MAVDYDTELQLHNRVLFQACAINEHDTVLDIGCGTGQTTLLAGRLAPRSNVLGIDISERSIQQARARAAREGLQNVRFEDGDAQEYAFLSGSFDLAMSRYGTMFFSDPIAAFRNIRSALSAEGRFVMMVWQEHENNDWSIRIEEALAPYHRPQPRDRQHFSLGDRDIVSRVLKAAGFAAVNIDEACEPVYYGPDVDAAVDWVCSFQFVQSLLRSVDADAKASALKRLRQAISHHSRETGVWLDAREWIVTARG